MVSTYVVKGLARKEILFAIHRYLPKEVWEALLSTYSENSTQTCGSLYLLVMSYSESTLRLWQKVLDINIQITMSHHQVYGKYLSFVNITFTENR